MASKDSAIWRSELSCKERWWSKADSGYQEQMVHRMDEGMVLLQGTLACLPASGEICARLAFAHEWHALSHGAPF
jgi:hypothetical protein